MTVALCLITWNELAGVSHDVPLIDKSQFDQIYCVDGGSTDGTIEFLEKQGIRVIQQKNRGINNACIEGVDHCECDAFVFFHPKGTIPPEDTYKFRKYFEEGYELVIGSRMIEGAVNEEDNKIIKFRKWSGLWLSWLSSLMFKHEGVKVYDVLHGFRGMTVKAFKKLQLPNKFSTSIDIEMVCRSYRKSIKRIEFPTIENNRIEGGSHFNVFNLGTKVVTYVFWERLFND